MGELVDMAQTIETLRAMLSREVGRREAAEAERDRLRKAVDQYVCGYCHNRVGYTPESGEWSLSVYHLPCREHHGCAPLREALASSGTATPGEDEGE